MWNDTVLASIKKLGRIVSHLVEMHHVVNMVIWEKFAGYVGEICFSCFMK